MMRKLSMLYIALVLLLPSAAGAQYSPDQLDRAFQARVLEVGEATKAQFPTAWRNAHNAGEPQGSEFVRRWALALRAQNVLACVNGKRGGDTLSQDVLSFPLTSGGAQDTGGKYAPRVAIIDVIVGAGGANPTLSWGDVSQFAPGKCIDPFLEAGEGSGSTPPPVTTPPPTQTVNLQPVLEALARLQADVAELKARPQPDPQKVDLGLVETYINDMVGAGPGGDPATVPNHVSDIKQRLDVIRVQLEQLAAWLRSRPVLRFWR